MCRPRLTGGLGILEPQLQQKALQMRWLQPSLDQQSTQSFVAQWIKATLRQCTPSGDIRLSMMFANLHPARLKNVQSAFNTLLTTTDAIPRNYSTITPTPATCLILPILDIIQFSDQSICLTKGWRKLRVSYAFIYDESLQALRSRVPSERLGSRYIVAKLLRNLQNARHCPLVAGISKTSTPFTFAKFGKSIRPCLTTSLLLHRLNGKKNWDFSIHYSVRNIWYRALHQSLSCSSHLHRIAPTTFPSPMCAFCSNGIDNIEHSLYLCPLKWPVWFNAWLTYFGYQPEPFDVHRALFHLDLPNSANFEHYLDPSQAISCIILSLWRAHWQVIFDSAPFNTQHVQSSVGKISTSFAQELDLS
ncbi:hypothetical protein PHYBLDRAFT_163261 [Phycomyces blakesleeanus NRRL 1555(-)]|uniref:Reverse transcriptase zinc-binding domain-containing protein n=1 Tax=Phycomyces blakesleeanus (strain ATCC 8743b / DSM 1359 / FGSC 10004 / NBRC 33097 / NRRL 1555) TaxID=763407 RepID=A0A167QT89_PHYB8|nr:hypothetical protein PHYBLDRAFT_163261 [Phycomyces blakesleeanus NRRL 1555(-)]OAD80238.1 hypothetical protein PHYBLDRAFT_163261 [Phycomyces blakesleeanus NRRL 1555(-)]|eukprot:XP_018298278.1 hypothetical protein PHYBLDRAFT_163261 [Phycomyces blakesleeanus NRRL 1555(-)]